MRDVQGDGERETNPSNEQPTTVNRQQDTPPAGYEVVPEDDQPTEQRTVAGSDIPPPPPPPPPPGYDDQPTEVGREAYGDETQVGRTVSDETRVGQTTQADVVDPDDPRSDQERRIERSKETSAAAVMREPAPPSEEGDDEQ